MRAVLIAIGCTFFRALDIPVFWPILVLYFIVVFVHMMHQRIRHAPPLLAVAAAAAAADGGLPCRHMVEHRSLPFTTGKPRFKGRDDTGPVVSAK